jgi:hypothetical protein
MDNKTTEYKGVVYDSRHGGPFDRGGADSWYDRPFSPHYFVGDTHSSELVKLADMTVEEVEAYKAGYDYNEEFGGKKDWN